MVPDMVYVPSEDSITVVLCSMGRRCPVLLQVLSVLAGFLSTCSIVVDGEVLKSLTMVCISF